jgi:hypothetical protein
MPLSRGQSTTADAAAWSSAPDSSAITKAESPRVRKQSSFSASLTSERSYEAAKPLFNGRLNMTDVKYAHLMNLAFNGIRAVGKADDVLSRLPRTSILPRCNS